MLGMLNDYQRKLMIAIVRGNPDGEDWDIDALMGELNHTASKQAFQCSLKILEKRGYLTRRYEPRRGARRMLIEPTEAGKSSVPLVL